MVFSISMRALLLWFHGFHLLLLCTPNSSFNRASSRSLSSPFPASSPAASRAPILRDMAFRRFSRRASRFAAGSSCLLNLLRNWICNNRAIVESGKDHKQIRSDLPGWKFGVWRSYSKWRQGVRRVVWRILFLFPS